MTKVPGMRHKFVAQCVTDSPKEDVLAIATSAFSHEYNVEKATSRRFGTVVLVEVQFDTLDRDNAVRLSQVAGSTLSHSWPTDTVTLDGKPVKHHGRSNDVSPLLEAAKQSGHLIIAKVGE